MYNNIHRILIYLREQKQSTGSLEKIGKRVAEQIRRGDFTEESYYKGNNYLLSLVEELISMRLMYSNDATTGETYKRLINGNVVPSNDTMQDHDTQTIIDWLSNDRVFDYMEKFAKIDSNPTPDNIRSFKAMNAGFKEARQKLLDFINYDLGFIGVSVQKPYTIENDINEIYYYLIVKVQEAEDIKPDENLPTNETIARHIGYVDGMISYAETVREFILTSLKYEISNNDYEPNYIYKRHNNGKRNTAYDESKELCEEDVKRVIKFINTKDHLTAPYEIRNCPSSHFFVKEHILIDSEIDDYKFGFQKGSKKMNDIILNKLTIAMGYANVTSYDESVSYTEKKSVLLPDYEVMLYSKQGMQVGPEFDYEVHGVSHIIVDDKKTKGRRARTKVETPVYDRQPTNGMTTAAEMIRYIQSNKYGYFTTKGGALKTFTIIEQTLLPDEEVLSCFYGLHNYISPSKHNNTHGYALTNKRLIFCRAGFWTGGNCETINISGITSIASQNKITSTLIIIRHIGGAFNVLLQNSKCPQLVNELSGLITK